MSDRSSEEYRHSRQLMLRSLRNIIGEYGWTVIGVFDPDAEDNMFFYTVGLTAKHQPELLMVDIRPQDGEFTHALLNYCAAEHIVKPYKPGDVISLTPVLNLDLRLRVTDVDAAHPDSYLGMAFSLYQNQVRALLLEPLIKGEDA